MNRISRIIIAAGLVMTIAAVASAGRADGGLKARIDELVAAERSFCRMASGEGIRPAFLRYLAPQSIVFRPGPVDGRRWYSDRAELPGLLTWVPEFAEIARSGDFGYTTGPWEFNEKAAADATAYGHYVSVWARQADGSWLVLIDVGCAHARHDRPVTTRREVATRGDGAIASVEELTGIDQVAGKAALLKADGAFSDLSASKGALEAYLSYAADDIRILRRDAPPAVGTEALKPVLPVKPALLTWRASGARIARSADLGFTYGIAELRRDDKAQYGDASSYLRIWRRRSDGDWKVALDLHNPVPRPAAVPGS